MPPHLLAFTAVAVVLIAVPGPGVLLGGGMMIGLGGVLATTSTS